MLGNWIICWVKPIIDWSVTAVEQNPFFPFAMRLAAEFFEQIVHSPRLPPNELHGNRSRSRQDFGKTMSNLQFVGCSERARFVRSSREASASV